AAGLEAVAAHISHDTGSVSEMLGDLRSAPRRRLDLSTLDCMLLRTNPARDHQHDWAHDTMLDFAREAKSLGVLVLNDPDGLARATNKLYLRHLPRQFRPSTMVTHQRDAILQFIGD